MATRRRTSAWSGLAMSGLLVKLRGRAAEAQSWAAEMIPAKDHATMR
jgi:hypothetical protein